MLRSLILWQSRNNYFCTRFSSRFEGGFEALQNETKNVEQTTSVDESSPLATYLKKIECGELNIDNHQRKIIDHLEEVYNKLKYYKPPERNIFQKLFMAKVTSSAPKGVYLHGAVGGGKTMLMDLFHNCAPISQKRRVHFHEFMLDVHQRIHQFKMSVTKDVSSTKPKFFDPIPPVAKLIKENAWLLCFDEFQVTDIGDAMILKRLFTELFDGGVVVIATSNRPPDDLYKNGLQRSNFVPFIQILKDHCTVLSLESGIDYRQKGALSKQRHFFVDGECDADKEMDHMFKILVSKENDTVRPKTLTLRGRNLHFAKTCGQVLDCTFEDLCIQPRGASDYLLLSQAFHTILIRNIPMMTSKLKGPARRFITMIDTFYDNKVRIICSAGGPYNLLFVNLNKDSDFDDEHRILMDDLNIDKGSDNAKASIFTGEEEIFAYDRTISRLSEMQTKEYWNYREST